ncbi:melatonin receptor type 1B-A-like [Branchiostoma lanceolatum]|uniref:melatonin receptor type 1B-A-like n=1 Tax=Branchiostoma lanceolatum TaxID=7740 RepID=UPI003454F14E
MENTVTSTPCPSERYQLTSPAKVTLVAILGVLAFVGAVGNTLTIHITLANRKRKRSVDAFIINLAAADVLIASVMNTCQIVGVVAPEVLITHPLICEVIGSICVIGCVVSLATAAAISLNRYLFIAKRTLHDAIFTKKWSAAILASFWIIGILYNVPMWLGWGSHGYDYKTMNCMYDRAAHYRFTLLFVLGGHIFPAITVVVCNGLLVGHIRATKRALAEHLPKTMIQADDVRVMKTLGIVCTSFVLGWLQYGVVVIADYQDQWSQAVHCTSFVLAHSSSTLNCLLYLVTNKEMRQKYLAVFWKKMNGNVNDLRRSSGIDINGKRRFSAEHPDEAIALRGFNNLDWDA